MKKTNNLEKELSQIEPGALVEVSWYDASTGKSSFGKGGCIDVPVRSWGVFIGVLGGRVKHIVLAQNSFCYADGFFDLDYTAIPLGMAISVTTLARQHIEKDSACRLVNSFLAGRRHALTNPKSPRTFQRRTFQHRLSVDGRPD